MRTPLSDDAEPDAIYADHSGCRRRVKRRSSLPQRICYQNHVQLTGADDLVPCYHERQLLPCCQSIQGCISFRTDQTTEIDFNEVDIECQSFSDLCLQDLETPLQWKLSSRTFREDAQCRL